MLIVGAARQGIALTRYLAERGARVTLNDMRPAGALAEAQTALADLPVRWEFGGHPLELLEGVDVVCPSGGVPLDIALIAEAIERGIALSNDSQIFLESAVCMVIGITGSAGKTTTATLVGRMAAAAFNAHSQLEERKVWVGGNIGSPLIEMVDKMQTNDLAVMELSSFQLELMNISPPVAVVLNLTPNHLDRHGTMEAYTAAKTHILEFQSSQDFAVLSRDDVGAWALAERVSGQLISFGVEEPPNGQMGAFIRNAALWVRNHDGETEIMAVKNVALRGEHNLQNVLAACAIAAAVGLDTQAMREGIEGFKGVAHRLEYVRHWGGADWYNDSIATAPERAIAAMKSFEAPLVLLAGGQDKDLPWDEFGAEVRARVDHLIVFGQAAQTVMNAVGSTGGQERPLSVTHCKNFSEAVQAAANEVEEGDVVLMSPGGTSYDEFKDFEERGKKFIEMVMAL